MNEHPNLDRRSTLRRSDQVHHQTRLQTPWRQTSSNPRFLTFQQEYRIPDAKGVKNGVLKSGDFIPKHIIVHSVFLCEILHPTQHATTPTTWLKLTTSTNQVLLVDSTSRFHHGTQIALFLWQFFLPLMSLMMASFPLPQKESQDICQVCQGNVASTNGCWCWRFNLEQTKRQSVLPLCISWDSD